VYSLKARVLRIAVAWIVTLIIPLEFVVLIAWWFWQAVTDYDPEGNKH